MHWKLFSSVTVARFTTINSLADAKWPAYIYSDKLRRLTAWSLVAVVLTVGGSAVWADSPSLDHLITKVAMQENLDPALLRAVVATESDFNNNTVSPDGAVGLMQLMPETARNMGVKNLFNPEQNLRGGARYLGKMLKKFPKIPHALAAYNAGPGMVSRFQGIPPLAETQRYVGKVLSYYKKPPTTKQKKSLEQKSSFNGMLFLTDARDLIASNARLLFKETQSSGKQNLPMISIRRTNNQVRHELPSTVAALAKSGRAAQLAMALSEELEGEVIPILRAAQ